MGKTIVINCAHCGKKIAEISFVPGTQVLSHHCNVRRRYEHWLGIARKTQVTITQNGEVYIKRA